MPPTYIAGFVWILIAGVVQGFFVLPMKYTRSWKWEHLWFWFSILAFFILPLIVAYATVPRLLDVYSLAPSRQIWLAAVFGLGWGAGAVFFGLGVDALGMALGFSVMTALTTAFGAFMPLVLLTPDLVFKRNGLMVIAGNVVTAVGVFACAVAGDQRDKLIGSQPAKRIGPKRSFAVAITFCILSGVLSGALNFGYAFCPDLMSTAEKLGATKDNAVSAMWLVLIPAGGLVNAAYCIFVMKKNKSWDRLVSRSTLVDWSGAWFMAVLWTGSVVVYGWGANDLGRLGATLGWSLWNAILIVTTFVCGLITHEWKGIHGHPLRMLYLGIAVMIAGMFVLGLGA
jgi:L-rhamnose-H+ transport protein